MVLDFEGPTNGMMTIWGHFVILVVIGLVIIKLQVQTMLKTIHFHEFDKNLENLLFTIAQLKAMPEPMKLIYFEN